MLGPRGGLLPFGHWVCSTQKRQLGTQSAFTGVLASPPGVSVVSPVKRARAVAGLRAIVGGAPVLFQEYRDIAMFPNSLPDVVHESREIINRLFVPIGWGPGPGDSAHVPVFTCESAGRWIAVFGSCTGVH